MGRVVITGASGTLGTSLLARPAAAGWQLRGVSRGAGHETDGTIEWARADLTTGEGLAAAVADADVLIHAASAPRGDTLGTDVEGTRRLLAAARAGGVGHVVYVSIVGVDRIPVTYYQAKLAAERVVEGAGVPWTVVRGTQFHGFVDALCRPLARLPVALAPAGLPVQPIDVDDFADALWAHAAVGPRGRAPDVGGPEVLAWPEVMRAWLRARGSRKPVLPLPVPGRVAAALRRGEGTAPEGRAGRLTWASWLARRYGAASR
jgi:uncharacterized protein YbjT (DUF2867 family)